MAGSKSKPDNTADKGSKHLTRSDYNLLLDWCEKPENKDKIDGWEKKTKVGVRPVVKARAYQQMADYLNQNQKKGSVLPSVDGKSMKNRWRHLLIKYRETKALTQSTGWGLTEKDYVDGLKTVEEKLEKECLCYARLDGIFGKSPAVDPKEWHGFQTRIGGNVPADVQARFDTKSWLDDADPKLQDASAEEQLPAAGQNSSVGVAEADNESEDEEVDEDTSGDGGDGVPDSIPNVVPDSIPTDTNGSQQPTMDIPSPEVTVGEIGDAQFVGESPGAEMRSRAHAHRSTQRTNVAGARRASSDREDGSGRSERDRVGTDRGVTRSHSQYMGKEKVYPSKKQVGETRHSINGAFANNLDVVNEQRARANELRALKINEDRQMEQQKLVMQSELHLAQREDMRILEEKKLAWERERFQHQMESQAAQQKESNNMQMMIALLGSNKTYEEITKLLALAGSRT